jgi:hypothetical protein
MIITKIFFINILILASIRTEKVQNFKVSKNNDINLTVGESNIISIAYKKFAFLCLAVCSSDPYCLTATYDKSQERITNCFTYNRYFITNEMILSSTSNVYQKQPSVLNYPKNIPLNLIQYFILFFFFYSNFEIILLKYLVILKILMI